jgi:hypothetical protein
MDGSADHAQQVTQSQGSFAQTVDFKNTSQNSSQFWSIIANWG